MRGAAYLVRVAAAVVVLETGVRRRRRQTCRHRTGARVVPLEFTCFCLCSRSLSPFACENRVRVGSGHFRMLGNLEAIRGNVAERGEDPYVSVWNLR